MVKESGSCNEYSPEKYVLFKVTPVEITVVLDSYKRWKWNWNVGTMNILVTNWILMLHYFVFGISRMVLTENSLPNPNDITRF